MADNHPQDWNTEDTYWRANYRNRPYASSGSYDYETYRPGYRYGYESAHRYQGKKWDDVESNLRSGWDRFEHRGERTWDQIKHAVRDGWDRLMGRR